MENDDICLSDIYIYIGDTQQQVRAIVCQQRISRTQRHSHSRPKSQSQYHRMQRTAGPTIPKYLMKQNRYHHTDHDDMYIYRYLFNTTTGATSTENHNIQDREYHIHVSCIDI